MEVKFECNNCGWCCTASEEEFKRVAPIVRLTYLEARQIADYLKISLRKFLDMFTTTYRGVLELRWAAQFPYVHNGGEPTAVYRCIFFNPYTKFCEIHPVNPHQCRTFPFWPDNFKSQEQWNAIGKFCEGVGRGDLITEDELTAKLKDKKTKTYRFPT